MDYREVSRLKANPTAISAVVAHIRSLLGDRATERQNAFLASILAASEEERLTTRQVESLLVMRDSLRRRSVVGGYRASQLLRRVYEARLDLDEDAEQAIIELYQFSDEPALTDSQWRLVFACARQLHIIDDAYISLAA